VEKGRDEKARMALESLHGTGQNEAFLEQEFTEIKNAVLSDQLAKRTTWKSLITVPSARKRLLLGCGAQFFCQVSGLNVINYYGK
jgi:hypothetical protein